MTGVTAAASDPGIAPAPDAASFTFDPLHRDMPLFAPDTATPISRSAFAAATSAYLGTAFTVRRNGLPLATTVGTATATPADGLPATFGGRGAGLALDPVAGMRLLAIDATSARNDDFVVTAEWQRSGGGGPQTLGALGTRAAIRGVAGAFAAAATADADGVLVLSISLADAASPWPPPAFTSPRPAGFPGATIALRAAQSGSVRAADGLLVALPAAMIFPGSALFFWVGDDGATYTDPGLGLATLAAGAPGQVYPPNTLVPSVVATRDYARLSRGAGGLVLTDPSRFGGTGVVFVAEVFTGVPQLLGAIASVDASGALIPGLDLPPLWPALTYAPAPDAPNVDGLLSILVQPIGGAANTPPSELIVTNRAGTALLVYLPGIDAAPAEGVRFLVAVDGSSYYFPADPAEAEAALTSLSLGQLVLARAALGQVWPIAGLWPLQQRIAVASDLGGAAPLVAGQLGIDPERGRFALPAGDPALPGDFSVDYAEAFADRVGALNFDRQIDPAAIATRLVAASGDAEPGLSAASTAPVYTGLTDAIAAAADGDIIEIADSATYAAAAPVVLANAAVRGLQIRARDGQRPCLTFYAADGSALPASFSVLTPMDQLGLSGLLVSGGPMLLRAVVGQVQIVASTLDPAGSATGALVVDAFSSGAGFAILLCRCITGAISLGASVSDLTVANSIVDTGGGFAIVGADQLTSPPLAIPIPANATVQLERVTVLGRVFCRVLSASECLLDAIVVVEDQQSGCIRFSRTEIGSVLPRRYSCVPTEQEATAWSGFGRLLAPTFNSRLVGRPAYGQLASTCPAEILTASESGAEVGCVRQPVRRHPTRQPADQAGGIHARRTDGHDRGDDIGEPR